MIRLAFVVDAQWRHGLSGVDTFCRNIMPLWAREGFSCEIIERPAAREGPASTQEAETPPGRESRAGFVRLALGYLGMLMRDVRFVWSHRRRLRGRVLLTNEFGSETLPIALRVVNPFSCLVAVCHTHPGPEPQAMHPVRRATERLCARSVSETICNSAALRLEWEARLGRLFPNGIVIHHGIPSPDPRLPADYPPRDGATVDFVCVARFAHWKGHALLLKAWRAALDSVEPGGQPPMRLVLVGDGPALGDIKKVVADNRLDRTVVFLGGRPEGDRYFNGGDVGVLMSTEPEAFGIVLLEAMSRGKPVLASRIGGIGEVVEDGVTGLLVDPFDAVGVSKTILSLARSVDLRARLGVAGRKRWEQHFTLDRMIDGYETYFFSLCGPDGNRR